MVLRSIVGQYPLAAPVPVRYLVAVLLVILALVLRMWLAPAAVPPFVTFFPAVALSAILAGLGPGLVATALGAVLAAIFFLPPLGDNADTLWSLAMYIADGVIVCAAVAAIHRYAGQLRNARRVAEESQRVAEMANTSKSQFLANVSHELRTPLNAVIGFSELVLSRPYGPIPDKYAEYIEDVCNSGRHLLGLINELLDLAAMEAGSVVLSEETVDLGETLQACIRQVRPRAEASRVGLAFAVPPLLAVRADQRRLKQIVLNLLSNAVKFTPEDGHVTLAASGNPAGGISVTVTDTGIGMDEQTVAKAVQPFGVVAAKLHRKEESVGLGLSITKALVELHGGTLTIESRLGKGTTARFDLPAERVVAEPAPTVMAV